MTQNTDFGTDLSCTDDLDPLCRDVSGVDLMIEALIRRMITPPGWLIDDPLYGLGLMDMLGEEIEDKDVPALAAKIQAQLLRDERVEAIFVRTTRDSQDDKRFLFAISGRSSEGPFTFTLAASAVTVELLKG